MALMEPLTSKNYHVLRYNSRGVGASTGRASFTGFSEVEDLVMVVQWVLDRIPDIRSLVILVWFFFNVLDGELTCTGRVILMDH